MTAINPYLTFDGNCEDAFNFYKIVFGGEFAHVSRFGEMPEEEGKTIPPEQANRIMHISLPISGNISLMGSDTGGEWASNYRAGNNISLSISTDSKEEADRIFNGLADRGKVTMPLDKTFWGEYFGMCTDQFGISWMMSYRGE